MADDVAASASAPMIEWTSPPGTMPMAAAGLTTPCILRFRLVTIPNGLFVRPLGRLVAPDRLRAEGALARMLLG